MSAPSDNALRALAAEINSKPPPDRLRLAASLLEAGNMTIAHAIVERVSIEMGAVLAVDALWKAGGG